MPEAPGYAVLGRGRWAKRIQAILSAANRRVTAIPDSRPRAAETEAAFQSRLALKLASIGAQCAWLCDPPGPYIPLTIESALHASLHVIVEKPWLYSRETTAALKNQSVSAKKLVGIHYEYCLFEAVEKWKREFSSGKGLLFGGSFTVSRPDSSGISPLANLGSHLLAIRAYAVPESRILEVICGYEQPETRRVWVEKKDGSRATIEFLKNQEPIIQRFVHRFEAASELGSFPFDLSFAERVAEELATLELGTPAGHARD